jgi:uncharacterized membrane protein
LLPLLYLLIPVRRVGTRIAYWIWFLLLIGATLVPVLGWTMVTQNVYTPVESRNPEEPIVIDPAAQIALVLSAPHYLAGAITRTLREDGVTYAAQFVGTLGWLDTFLPAPFRVLYLAVLVVTAVSDSAAGTRLGPRNRLVLVALGLGSILLLMTIAYVMWNRVGASLIYGLQGRYFIPIAPLLFLPLYNGRVRLPEWGKAALVLFVVASSLYTLYILLARYWLP